MWGVGRRVGVESLEFGVRSFEGYGLGFRVEGFGLGVQGSSVEG